MLTFGMRFCEEVFEVFNKLVVGNSAASFHHKITNRIKGKLGGGSHLSLPFLFLFSFDALKRKQTLLPDLNKTFSSSFHYL